MTYHHLYPRNPLDQAQLSCDTWECAFSSLPSFGHFQSKVSNQTNPSSGRSLEKSRWFLAPMWLHSVNEAVIKAWEMCWENKFRVLDCFSSRIISIFFNEQCLKYHCLPLHRSCSLLRTHKKTDISGVSPQDAINICSVLSLCYHRAVVWESFQSHSISIGEREANTALESYCWLQKRTERMLTRHPPPVVSAQNRKALRKSYFHPPNKRHLFSKLPAKRNILFQEANEVG